MKYLVLIVLHALLWGTIGTYGQFFASPEDAEWRRQAYLETSGAGVPNTLSFYRSQPRIALPTEILGAVDSKWPSFSLRLQTGLSETGGFPIGTNQAGLWTGVGFSSWSRASAQIQWEGFSLSLGGYGAWIENKDFPLQASGLAGQPLADLWGATIDAPQRFGVQSFWDTSPDAMEISYSRGALVASLSTEPLWFGPGLFNSLLLSSNAKGFPHALLGLENYDTVLGRVETNLVLGRLETSGYWKSTAPRSRFFGGLFVAYSPAFFPELTLGLGRTIFSYWDEVSWKVPLTLFSPQALTIDDSGVAYDNAGGIGTGESHQHAAITWRLAFPSIGFETYGEWAKNDFSSMVRLYLTNADHMQAYTLGMRKTFSFGLGGLLGVSVELTNAGQSLESLINWNKMAPGGEFYNHWAIEEGYTNRGEILGASIGNGNSQTLAVDYYESRLDAGIQLQRFNPYSSFLYYGTLPSKQEYRTDSHYLFTLRAGWKMSSARLSAKLDYDYDFNRYFKAWSAQSSGDSSAWRFSVDVLWTMGQD